MEQHKDPPLEPKVPATGAPAPQPQQDVARDPGNDRSDQQPGERSAEGDRMDTEEMRELDGAR